MTTEQRERLLRVVRMGGLDMPLLDALWYAFQCYSVHVQTEAGAMEQQWIWYMMDELGSGMRRIDSSANFMSCAFYHMGRGECVTLVWPIRSIKKGDVCTVDALQGIHDVDERHRLACAYDPKAPDTHSQVFKQAWQQLVQTTVAQPLAQTLSWTWPSTSTPLTYYLDPAYDHPLGPSIAHSRNFVRTHDMAQADIIWVFVQSHASRQPHQYLNHFEGENTITVKDLLMSSIYSTFGRTVHWIPETYNLQTECSAWLGAYRNDVWITKPWNGTRSQGCTVSNNLAQLLKQMSTGPKIIQKYLERPCLLDGCKFDLRVLVGVISLQPLVLVMHKRGYYARLASNPYVQDDWHVFETHFTA
jgi:hypothetical protein